MSTTHRAGERKFLFLLAGSRPDGNTETLVRRAAAALPENVEQQWLRLSDLPLPAFEDRRHVGPGVYPEPAGNARVLLDATLAATDLVIASPLYWYSLSASAKLYLDHWSGWMRVPGVDFKPRMAGKTMWSVSTLSSEDHAMAGPLIGTLRNCADYLTMHWGGSLLGYANAPGQILADTEALRSADSFFPATVRP
ncbi:NAD(P)H-dependent oxidoreductase [Kitasatospora sp. NBC_00070]|uniref:flavodoxin family protein n=1 Tax=Kitasatospora sp. NBC_00070 TaxID=2975962 RepID=UPI003244CA09